MPEPTEFQRATIDHVCRRFDDPAGSGRFLVADEVGLGKTLVAAGVIKRMAEQRSAVGRRHFTVIYMCSNQELAAQNRTRLLASVDVAPYRGPDGDTALPRRLTMVAPAAVAIQASQAAGGVLLYSFTPGTSLEVKDGRGMVRERQLLFAALRKCWPEIFASISGYFEDWRTYFCCGAPTSWPALSASESLDRLAEQLDCSNMLNAISQAVANATSPTGHGSLLAHLQACRSPPMQTSSLIGALRLAVARASLEFLKPDLVILDEFQRFQHVLDMKNGGELPRLLLDGPSRAKVLVLSATPYNLVSRPGEAQDHYSDLFNTLRFLAGPSAGAQVDVLREDFRKYHLGLAAQQAVTELMPVKRRIEATMLQWLCRTERLWYLADLKNDIRPVLPAERSLGQEEIGDYFSLHHLVRGAHGNARLPSGCIIDFWKSAPTPLAFMDSGYALHQQLKSQGRKVPSRLVPPEKEHKRLAARNHRMSQLLKLVWDFAGPKERAWRHLWVRPTYTYHQDEFYRAESPTKLLIFSHWRFVPRAISFVVSGDVEGTLPTAEPGSRAARGVQFNLEALRVCFPFVWLAEIADPFVLATEHAGPMSLRKLRGQVRKAVVAHLAAAGISVGARGRSSPWSTLVTLESKRTQKSAVDRVVAALKKAGESAQKLVKLVEAQLAAGAPRVLSATAVAALVDIALGSPAVCIARAVLRGQVTPAIAFKDTLQPLDVLGFQALRAWANKEYVQAIVTLGNRSEKHHARRLVRHCIDAHFQAVVDEYMHPMLGSTVAEACAEFGRVLDLGHGAPRANLLARDGSLTKGNGKSRRAYFALAFGDVLSSDTGSAANGNPTSRPGERRTAMREAFNSPFWPFVLATTSVGQEGLDFHRYCQDIVHWNIPGSPVDLEQREGRLNRYDALFLRRNIASDHPLPTLRGQLVKQTPGPLHKGSPWDAVFRTVGLGLAGHLEHRHGLYPHWAYEGRKKDPIEGTPPRAQLRRHLFMFAGSRDESDYRRLEGRLRLYRLALGHPRQYDHMDQLERGTKVHEDPRSCIVNLSPMTADAAHRRARDLAKRIAGDSEAVQELVVIAREMVACRAELDGVRDKVLAMCAVVADCRVDSGDDAGRSETVLRQLATLAYLVDPYDAFFDSIPDSGLADDVAMIDSAEVEVA